MIEVVCKSLFGDEYSLWFDYIPSDEQIISNLKSTYDEWEYCDEFED